jgi:hypothetical protein
MAESEVPGHSKKPGFHPVPVLKRRDKEKPGLPVTFVFIT